MVFIEVKTRASTQHGRPEDAVDREKQTRLTRAASLFSAEELAATSDAFRRDRRRLARRQIAAGHHAHSGSVRRCGARFDVHLIWRGSLSHTIQPSSISRRNSSPCGPCWKQPGPGDGNSSPAKVSRHGIGRRSFHAHRVVAEDLLQGRQLLVVAVGSGNLDVQGIRGARRRDEHATADQVFEAFVSSAAQQLVKGVRPRLRSRQPPPGVFPIALFFEPVVVISGAPGAPRNTARRNDSRSLMDSSLGRTPAVAC